MKKNPYLLLFLWMFFLADTNGVALANEFDLTLSSDTDITIKRFPGKGDRVLWISTEYGIREKKHYPLLQGLADFNHEVWMPKLHESYFIPPGRTSYTRIPVADVSELIQKSLPDGNKKLFIVTSGRGAVLSLLGLRHWIHQTGGSDRFAGILLISPNFLASSSTPGKEIKYLSVIDNSSWPVFIMQPAKSNRFWYLEDVAARLTSGGSQVYIQKIKMVGDGFHVRRNPTKNDLQQIKEFPGKLSKAINLLGHTQVDFAKQQPEKPDKPWQMSAVPETLQTSSANLLAPLLELSDISGIKHSLEAYNGKVVVINFWASWCPPCVEELPSLDRLQKKFPHDKLVVLTVNVGETKEEVIAFLQRVKIDLPVLLNPEGNIVKEWKIIAFPATFVVDQEGLITHSYFGGLEWDHSSVVETLTHIIMI